MSKKELEDSIKYHSMQKQKLSELEDTINEAKSKKEQLNGSMDNMKAEIRRNVRKLQAIKEHLDWIKPMQHESKKCLPCISKPPSYVASIGPSIDVNILLGLHRGCN